MFILSARLQKCPLLVQPKSVQREELENILLTDATARFCILEIYFVPSWPVLGEFAAKYKFHLCSAHAEVWRFVQM
jgi:hypothetical protein